MAYIKRSYRPISVAIVSTFVVAACAGCTAPTASPEAPPSASRGSSKNASCTSLPVDQALVTPVAGFGDEPSPAKAVAPGVYALSSIRYAGSPSPSPLASTLALSVDGRLEQVTLEAEGSVTRRSGTYKRDGDALTLTWSCPYQRTTQRTVATTPSSLTLREDSDGGTVWRLYARRDDPR